MDKRTKKQLKRQSKALKKALKQSLKQAGKSAANSVVELDKKQLKAMADKLVQEMVVGQAAQPKVVAIRPLASDPMSFARRPYKKTPCKRCPALAGGLCACAIKKQKRAA
ncbi:hypothetical protein SAMN04488540_10924 [Ferrimonas sediminum]|uniref:Uncharacterized protein n=1 Tax=Ferrimonas sediminum TaxID=718193 RepID=A0A1G8UAE8_9GAMM|nr:hypothetical protein [Ferrimonas sediminum]SDJ50711.1 hypothetical protein SAMN04488540_10924 [Ferrimonas sediminum]